MRLYVTLALVVPVLCSLGDHLPEYTNCYQQCYNFQCLGKKSIVSTKFSAADFEKIGNIYFPFKQIFGWNCENNCDYKCQQIITDIRIQQHDPIVKFRGKWPFVRVFGMQEIASVFFSLLNLFINYHNFKKIVVQYRKNLGSVKKMYLQYLFLLGVSMMGWIFSSLFHCRDLPLTETLDYFGASLIIISNFYIIVVRYFELFTKNLIPYQLAFGLLYTLHLIKLSNNWNYDYNLYFHTTIGVITLVLWVAHSLKVQKIYNVHQSVLSSSIQLLPFETKILLKLNYISLSKSKFIPILPIFLNLWLLLAMSFEIWEFVPVGKIVDSHSIWHLMTFFPQIIWYDWNIWDLEVFKKIDNKII